MFQERNLDELVRLLNKNNIAYVGIDDGVRGNSLITNLNESVFQKNFEKVFVDTENKYGNLTIYKVPIGSTDDAAIRSQSPDLADVDMNVPAVTAFQGGQGKGRGQFNGPRGIAVDGVGNLYIADTGNARIQKFSPDGNFLSTIGLSGTGEGELQQPNGIVVDSVGNIYVVDATKQRLLQFKPDGTPGEQRLGSTLKFFGARSVAIGTNNQLYILDQGNSRVVVPDPNSDKVFEWGTKGSGEGEFAEPTGLEVGGDRVYVADAGNDRIQVFDLNGNFKGQWPVPEWSEYPWRYPGVAFDPEDKRLYVTSPLTKEILVFDTGGNRLEPLKPADPSALENPSALALSKTKTGKRLYVLNTGSSKVYVFNLEAKDSKDKTSKRQL